MDPDAPGLFSTMNCCPIDSFSLTAIKRAIGSTVPPGGKGTTNLTGLVGQFTLWAVAGSDASAAQNASPATARRPNNVLIMLSPLKNSLSIGCNRAKAEVYHCRGWRETLDAPPCSKNQDGRNRRFRHGQAPTAVWSLLQNEG